MRGKLPNSPWTGKPRMRPAPCPGRQAWLCRVNYAQSLLTAASTVVSEIEDTAVGSKAVPPCAVL